MAENRNSTYMIATICVGITLSVGAYLFTHLRSKPDNRSNAAASGELQNVDRRSSEAEIHSNSKLDLAKKIDAEEVKNVDGFSGSEGIKTLDDDKKLLLPDYNDLVSEEFLSEAVESPDTPQRGSEEKQVNSIDCDMISEQDRLMWEEAMANNAAEIEILRNRIQELQKREENYKSELFEHYSIKEQRTELESQLKLNAVEIEMLNLKINSLEAQKKKVEAEVAQASSAKKELDYARATIKKLQRRIQMESIESKRQRLMLQRKIKTLGLLRTILKWKKNDRFLKELQMEVIELRRTNKELHHEKRELMVKLDMAEAKIASLSKIGERETNEKAKDEANLFRHENEDLLKQAEELQNYRFKEVEELVYLKWLNACLHNELRNSKTVPEKMTAEDLNKSLSPRSQEKAKQLMVENAGPDVLGMLERESFDIKSDDFDYLSIDSSASSEHSRSKESSFIHKIKKLRKIKDESIASRLRGESKGSPSRVAAAFQRISETVRGTRKADHPAIKDEHMFGLEKQNAKMKKQNRQE